MRLSHSRRADELGRAWRFLFVGLLSMACVGPALAQTQTLLTFNAHQYGGDGFTVVRAFPVEQGYVFSTSQPDGESIFAVWNSGDENYRGSPALIAYTCCETILSRTNGGFFDFHAIAVAGVQPFSSGVLDFSGYRGPQLVAQQSIAVALGGNFETWATMAFTNLTEVRWSGMPVQFDNVVVVSSAVNPLPPQIKNFTVDNSARGEVTGLKVSKTYVWESSTNLFHWQPLRTWVATSTSELVGDTKRPGARFYRVHELP